VRSGPSPSPTRQALPPSDLEELRVLLIDEKVVRKHHGYVTLVMNGIAGDRGAAVSGVEALRAFARSLLRAKEEVLTYCKHGITTARLEAFHNTVSRLIHRACGVRDTGYLFFKLRQESLACDPPK
jgi:hypothetical protein